MTHVPQGTTPTPATEQAEPRELLWDDDRIESALAWVKHRGLTAGSRAMLKQMRDDYEAKLNEYQGVYLYYIELAEKNEAQIAELTEQVRELERMVSLEMMQAFEKGRAK